VPVPTGLPAAQLTLVASPPAGTPADAGLQVVVLDLVTGLPYNSTAHPMQRLDDGRWSVTLTPPSGSVLAYRFARQNPSPAEEWTLDGAPVRYRLAHVTGPTQLEETIAAWAEGATSSSSGRIEGTIVDATTGLPIDEALVGAGGVLTFSDGTGWFRLNGLPPGSHTLTALMPDGSYLVSQQGAVVAAESATPAELRLTPANRVQVTFELTVPSDTTPGIPVRMAGNLRQLGAAFGELAGGLTTTSSRMPTLIMVDPTHYLMILEFFAGTDLHYKYTLGDGLWNAERDAQGFFHTRQVIIPQTGLLVQDTVATWHSGAQGPVTFHITVPENTPPVDTISLQLNPFVWMDPLPMWRQGNSEWTFVLFSPLDFAGSIAYRACRNFQCGVADDSATAGPDAAGVAFTPSDSAQDIQGAVAAWQDWDTDPPTASIVAPEITPVAGFEAGLQWLPKFHPSWLPLIPRAMADVVDMSANSLTLSPAWVVQPDTTAPVWSFDPVRSPFGSDLADIASQARQAGLEVALRPSLVAKSGDLAEWWMTSERSAFWWDRWFEAYRSLALTYAARASAIGASRLVLGGTELTPALPGGRLPDGTPSGVPSDSELRWRELISEVRSRFSGTIAFEIELGDQSAPVPAFVDIVDEVRAAWRVPLGTADDRSFAALEDSAEEGLDRLTLGSPLLAGRPLILVVEVPSVDGGSLICVPAASGPCHPPSDFDLDADVDPAIPLDLLEQAEAINALLLHAYLRPEIHGLIVARYNPAVWLRDKSASIGGKPARDVVWYWFPRLLGR
jgi:hypothetical protein